jgi:regulator of sigma E protease
VSNMLVTVVSFIVVLGVLVFVHELGHFLAAKWAGIRVFRFSLGMGAPIRRLTFTRSGTEYAICWLPLGGYVKMASQEEMAGDALEGPAPEEQVPRDETFEAKPVWKRMVVILAGVTMNALFAWMVFSGVLYKNGRPVNPTTTVGRVADSGLPAAARPLTALQAGDRITAINGRPVASWEEIVQGIQQAAGDSVMISVEGKPAVVLPIHHDALEQRVAAGLALWPDLPPVIGQVLQGRPAAKAGVQTGDTVLALDGQPIREWYDMVGLLATRGGAAVTMSVGRAAGRVELTVTPYQDTVKLPGGGSRAVGRIGVYPKGIENRFQPLTLGQAIADGGQMTLNTSTFIWRSVRGMLTGRISAREVGGPIAIGQSAGEAARQGAADFLVFMGLISVNLAVINLLPIPVLDGGQFLFLLGEGILGRPLPLRLRQRLTALGLLLIGLLMVLAFSNDIRRLLGL